MQYSLATTWAKRLKIRFRAVAKRQRASINKFVNQPAAASMNRFAAASVTSALPTCQNEPNRDSIMRTAGFLPLGLGAA